MNSLIITTYNRNDTLSNLLQYLENMKKLDEIIIVDDNSNDQTKETMSSEIYSNLKRIKYVYLTEKSGLPLARNVGIYLANGENIGFYDDDCVPLNLKSFEVASEWLKNSKILGVGGPVYYRNTKPLEESALEVGLIKYENGEIIGNWNKKIDKNLIVDILPGGNAFCRKKEARETLFNPCYNGNYYREETSFWMRMKKNNPDKKIIFDPSIPVNHLRVPSGGCRVSAKDWYKYVTSNTLLLIINNWKNPLNAVLKYSFNYLKKILTNTEDKRYYNLARSELLKAYYESIFLTIKKKTSPNQFLSRPKIEIIRNY